MSSAIQMRARKPFVQAEHERSEVRPESYVPPEETEEEQQQGASQSTSTSIDMKEKLSQPRQRSLYESVFWVAACCFILAYGDGKRHFLAAVLKSPLVVGRPFYIACLCSAINLCIISYLTLVVRFFNRDPRHFDFAAPGAVSTCTLLGVFAYILFSVALWPLFGFWIIPIIWCFFMGLVVLASLVPSITEPNPKYLHMRED